MTEEEDEALSRQSANVLLDMVSAWTPEADAATNTRAIATAVERFTDLEAIRATLDDDDGVTVNIDPILGGAIRTIKILAGMAAAYGQVDEHEIIGTARELLDYEP